MTNLALYLGPVLADMWWMDASNASSRHIQAVPDEAPVRTRRQLGEILIELGFVTRVELDSALETQRTTGGRIGEILVDQGCLTRIDLACALAEQWEPYPSTDAGDGLQSDDTVRLAADQPPAPEAPPHLAALKSVDETVDEIARSVEGLTSAREADALALDERFAALSQRLDQIESQSGEIAQLETRLAAVSELATELRGELGAQAQQQPGNESGDRLLELSVRIDRAARDSHDRIVALADELRADITARSTSFDARLQAQLDALAAVEQRFEDVQEAAAAALARAEETTEALHVETGSLAGRLDELFGLRHADAQVARVANERLAARLAEIPSESGGRRNGGPTCDGRRGAHPSSGTARLVRRGRDSGDRARCPRGARRTREEAHGQGDEAGQAGQGDEAFARLARSGDCGGRCQARRARLRRLEALNACGPPVAGRRSFDQRTCVT